MATLASIVFGQGTVPLLAPFEWILNILGLAVTVVLLGTYFKKGQDYSFWLTPAAKTIYLMAIAIGLTPMELETYASALGGFGALMVNILTVLLRFAGIVAIKPMLLSGVIALSVEMLNDLYVYAKKGKLFEKFPKLE